MPSNPSASPSHSPSASPSPSDFARPTDGAVTESDEPIPDGIYRVVGTPDGSVTLLRVGDAAGDREVTGTIVRVGRETYRGSFEDASEPRSSPLRAVVGRLTAMGHLLSKPIYWLRER